MRKHRISTVYVGPLCGDCVCFGRCLSVYGIEVRDRPCPDFFGRDGR
jgi:hypothetical protein